MIQEGESGLLQIVVQITAKTPTEVACQTLDERFKLQEILGLLRKGLFHDCLLMLQHALPIRWAARRQTAAQPQRGQRCSFCLETPHDLQ